MDKLKLLSTIFSKLESLTKNNGQIIISRDSKSLYVDLEGERIEITDWIDVDTEENLLAILTPLTNKYYYTKDNNKIWRYINNDWKCLNTSVNDLTPTYTESSTLVKLSSGEKLSVSFGKISKAITDLISHIGDSIKHITNTERTNWDLAKKHADSTHAPADAQKNVQSDWSATSGDAYIKNKPTEFPPSIHTHIKSEISDFPSSLPASGGNADTVNNHTVKSNVPTDAVFTDTIYDDTEVKESIAELNSNLSQLEFGEIAGGKNLLKESTFYITNESKSITDYDIPVGTYTISFYSNVGGTVDFFGLQDNSIIGGGNCVITPSGRSTKTFTVITPSKLMCYANVSTTITDIQIEEGETATDYEPYIPSVKMLAEENAQQNTEAMDLKMLGWTVPSECPIQNYVDADGIFHQRVGRVDLGTLNWTYDVSNTQFYTDIISQIKQDGDWIYDVYCSKYITASYGDKRIALNRGRIYIGDSSYTDGDSLKHSLRGVYLYFELSTPITINIDGNETVNDLNRYKPKQYYGKSITIESSGMYLVTATAMGYGVMACTYIVYTSGDVIRHIEKVSSINLTLSESGNVITPSYTENDIYFYVQRIANFWSR